MTSSAPSALSALFADALACTRCGSEDVFPAPGPFGALGILIGLARHHCRPCGRLFWAKASAEYTWVEEAELEDFDESVELLEAPSTASPDAVAPDIDIDVFRPAPEPVDLTALDAEFARRCAPEKPRRRRRKRQRQREREREREQKTPALARSS